MEQFCNSIETAVATRSDIRKGSEATFSSAEPMESRDHFKNGASSKSHTIRGNFWDFFALMVVFPFLLVSCGKNEIDDNSVIHDYRVQNVLYAKGSILQRVYQVSENGRTLYAVYKYDSSNRISRIDYTYGYDTYLYNAHGQLEKISKYNENLSDVGSIVVYSYDEEGNKIKEQMIPEKELMLGWYCLFQYTNGLLSKQEMVVDGQSPQHFFYEYEGEKVMNIKSNSKVTENFYDQNLLIRSTSYDMNDSKFIENEVKYYYDRNDNLIKRTINDRMSGSSSFSTDPLIFKWEYEYE